MKLRLVAAGILTIIIGAYASQFIWMPSHTGNESPSKMLMGADMNSEVVSAIYPIASSQVFERLKCLDIEFTNPYGKDNTITSSSDNSELTWIYYADDEKIAQSLLQLSPTSSTSTKVNLETQVFEDASFFASQDKPMIPSLLFGKSLRMGFAYAIDKRLTGVEFPRRYVKALNSAEEIAMIESSEPLFALHTPKVDCGVRPNSADFYEISKEVAAEIDQRANKDIKK